MDLFHGYWHGGINDRYPKAEAMIKVKGRIVTFTGKDLKTMKKLSKDLGLSVKNVFIGMIWELIMTKAREGWFKHER